LPNTWKRWSRIIFIWAAEINNKERSIEAMFGKIVFRADLKVLTGMHIGGGSAFSAIGAVDSPVVRDARTKLPIIPGSSLKGKLRTLLARSLAQDITRLPEPNEDHLVIKRLFGASEPVIKSRLQFADSFLLNKDELERVGLTGLTEIKFENTISRSTSVANPRQIERVISGSVFGFCVVYDLENKNEMEEDMEYFVKGLRLLQSDYLGGHGTRGYGRVSFENFRLEQVEKGLTEDEIQKISKLFKEVENYALLPV
jgi:CRISPR-associated protein Csm3